jgi:hypothetical protein
MIIEGKKLELTKEAFLAYEVYLAQKINQASDTEAKKWNEKFEETEKMLKDIELNLQREKIPETYGG